MEVTCVNCSKVLDRSPSSVRGKRNFCSRECRKAFHRPSSPCPGCGVPVERKPANPATKYCSWECFKRSRWQDAVCAECGTTFKKRACEVAKADAFGHKHMCSRSCRNASTSRLLGGDGSWAVGGKYAGKKPRGKDWVKAKRAALERDNHTCQQCEATDNLEVHHWEPYWISFDNSLDNLVTLCRPCHQDKHAEYIREGFYEDLHR